MSKEGQVSRKVGLVFFLQETYFGPIRGTKNFNNSTIHHKQEEKENTAGKARRQRRQDQRNKIQLQLQKQ